MAAMQQQPLSKTTPPPLSQAELRAAQARNVETHDALQEAHLLLASQQVHRVRSVLLPLEHV